MSIAALRWAFRLQGLRPATKAVLVALADHANQDGTCYPSLATMVQWTALSERAVRGALRDLEAAGYIQTRQECGRNSHYSLACAAANTPAGNAGGTPEPAAGVGDDTPAGYAGVDAADPGRSCPPPRQELPGTPAGAAPEPLITPINPQKGEGVARATRLAPDWEPSPANLKFAAGLGLDGHAVAAVFRDYWISRATQIAAKRDWDATWRNWCRKDAERKPKPRRNGFLAVIDRERRAEQLDQAEHEISLLTRIPSNVH